MAGVCHPHYVETARCIVRHQGIELVETGFGPSGTGTAEALAEVAADGDLVAVVVQQPNFFGAIEPVDDLAAGAKANGALTIAVVNPVALAALKPPGQWNGDGVDIACGDGQPLGVPMASGGPSLGFLCARRDHVRQLPGRLVGRTVDANGRIGYALTLQAREQHIRRGKATSNICTNQGLLVTAATIHMALLGASGLGAVAAECQRRTRQLVAAACAVGGVTRRFDAPHFHECVLDLGRPADAVAASPRQARHRRRLAARRLLSRARQLPPGLRHGKAHRGGHRRLSRRLATRFGKRRVSPTGGGAARDAFRTDAMA